MFRNKTGNDLGKTGSENYKRTKKQLIIFHIVKFLSPKESKYFFFKRYQIYIYRLRWVFLALGLHCCAWAFSSWSLRGLVTAMASRRRSTGL